ncbi:MAG: AMP-binding protein [Bdellovibrionales bacterium]
MIRIKSQKDYENYYALAKENPDQFWAEVASQFRWIKKWETLFSGSFSEQNIKWFSGAQLNITENCLDRHLLKSGNKTAIIYEPNDIAAPMQSFTYNQLASEVNKVANYYKSVGVKKGDRICFYMSMVPELLIGVLACARIGAVHSVVFGGFSAKALADRINDCQAKILVTNDGGHRGDKLIPLKDICDEALNSCTSIECVLVHRRANNEIKWQHGRDKDWKEVISSQSDLCEAEPMEAEDPLFYTLHIWIYR